ncbi:SCO family protein [Thalassotalea psychrophila]|uniref:SCO family protein n=1 Tax=Thalassotalea psychrophila TaxID=3065647 RepID=A0ABY9TPK9_9GAMM|nr:SCO family protein [Colwelliaceae bacterium SQ149]
MNAPSKLFFAGIGFILFISISILIYLTFPSNNASHIVPPRISGTILITPYELAPFTLVDQNNHLFNNDNLIGNWHLISYGYLQCPDVCPTTLLLLTKLKEQLQNKPYIINYVFYSVDSNRDRPENIKQYLRFFDDKFIGLTQDKLANMKDAFADTLGIKANVETNIINNVPQVNVSHGVHLFLINPTGKLVAVFKPYPSISELDNTLPTFNQAWLFEDITKTIDYINIKHSS